MYLQERSCWYILGAEQRHIPYVIDHWRKHDPGQDYTDGQIWTFADRAGWGPDGVPYSVTYYQYSWDRVRRTLKRVYEQVAKAQRAVAGHVPVKRIRYVNLKAANKTVNYELADKHRAVAGIKGHEVNRVDLSAEQVIAAYRQLFKIEKSFRMAKSDLKARPICHRKKESIDAHLTVVMCAMACGRILEQATVLSLKRLVRTRKKYRSFTLDVDGQTIHAHAPLPADVAELIAKLPKSD